MKRISLALLAVLALAINACEKHSAAETASVLHDKHASGEHEAGHDAHQTEAHAQQAERAEAHAAPAPKAPEGVPLNPAGSGPTDPHDGNKDKGTGGSGDPGVYKYFPEGGKK